MRRAFTAACLVGCLLGGDPTDEATLERRAKSGNVAAQLQLAEYLQNGRQKDFKSAQGWLLKAAATGDPSAERMLGRFYELGPRPFRNIEAAVRCYQQAADQGDAWALNNLGTLYWTGKGVPLDVAKAGRLLHASADKNDRRGLLNYADWLMDNPASGSARHRRAGDVSAILDLYLKAASQGDTDAMRKLASCYKEDNNLGLPESPAKYAEWTRRAAEAGDTDAMVSLGWACEHGYGVHLDGSKAIEWATKAARAGHLQAMTNLGILYDQGTVVPRDLSASIAWFRKGDEAGSWTSTYELAIRYREGIGVKRDYKEAVRLFQKSAGFGWGQAWLGLGHMYQDGFGTPQDYHKALDCYFMGARRWDPTSVNNVAAFYEHGYGIPKNPVMAWCWFWIAAQEGSDHASINLDRLEQSMGIQERLAAKRELPNILRWLRAERISEDHRVEEMLDQAP